MLNLSNNKNHKQYIKLTDYKLFDYEIPNIFLDFIIEDKKVIVKTNLKLIKKILILISLALTGLTYLLKKYT